MTDAKSELYELSRIGAIGTKNSGRGKFDKGDGLLLGDSGEPVFTCDVKEYGTSYALSESNLIKISSDAVKNHTQPLLQCVIGAEEPRQRFVVISERMFLELWELYKKEV